MSRSATVMTGKKSESLVIEYEKMLPHELETAVAAFPVAYVPWGTLEWHGPHLPVGLDAIKAHALCLRIARTAGGVVLPACYLSRDGMRFPWTFKYPPAMVRRALWTTLERLDRNGFRAAIVITGHYPLSQVFQFIAIAEAFMLTHKMAVAAGPEFFMGIDKGYAGDHAAKWETAILMELFPDLVDIEQLRKRRSRRFLDLFHLGVMGEDPAVHADPALGGEIVEHIVSGFAELACDLAETPNKDTARRYHRKAVGDMLNGSIHKFGRLATQILNENSSDA